MQVLLSQDVVGELWKFLWWLEFIFSMTRKQGHQLSENGGGRVASVRKEERFERWSKPGHCKLRMVSVLFNG